jgi:putative transposase
VARGGPAGAVPAAQRQRLGTSTTAADRLAAEHPDHVWALDYQFDQTEDGRRLKLLNVVDEHTREALTITVDRRIDADETVKVLDRLVAERGRPPRFIRMDNGPELTANALRDWCRFTGAGTSYIEPGSPWQNPYVESFGGRLRDELLAVEAFNTLLEAQVLVEDWRIEYNTVRPHSALGYLTPTDYAKAWTGTHPELSSRMDQQPGSGQQDLILIRDRQPGVMLTGLSAGRGTP